MGRLIVPPGHIPPIVTDVTGLLLPIALAAAVPLHIAELTAMPPRVRDSVAARWAADAVDPIASHGDALVHGGRRGEAARTFAATARGLAAAALQPGGVSILGQHWCTDHAACEAGEVT